MQLTRVSKERTPWTRDTTQRAQLGPFCLIELFPGRGSTAQAPRCLWHLLATVGLLWALSAEQIVDYRHKYQKKARCSEMALFFGNNSTDGCNKPVVMTCDKKQILLSILAMFPGSWQRNPCSNNENKDSSSHLQNASISGT